MEQLPSKDELLTALKHDKKAAGKQIHTVVVDRVGNFRMEDTTAEKLLEKLEAVFEKD
jgi:3-dehydroquinate synthetase